MRDARHLVVFATMLQIGGCVRVGGSDEARRAIEASRAAYVVAMKQGDARALASHFSDDAILLPQNADMLHGRAAIEHWFASWLPTTTVQDFAIASENITTVGGTAYEVGTYQMTFVPRGAGSVSEAGKYLMVWHRGADGHWSIVRDMFNSGGATR